MAIKVVNKASKQRRMAKIMKLNDTSSYICIYKYCIYTVYILYIIIGLYKSEKDSIKFKYYILYFTI
jgi:hypothetical protein